MYLSKNFAQVLIIGALSSICLAPGGSRPPPNSGSPGTGFFVPPPIGRPAVGGTGTIILTPPAVGAGGAPSTGLQPPSSSIVVGIGGSRPPNPGGGAGVLTPPAGGVIRPLATPSPTPRPCAPAEREDTVFFQPCLAINDYCGIRYNCVGGCLLSGESTPVKMYSSRCFAQGQGKCLPVQVPTCERRNS